MPDDRSNLPISLDRSALDRVLARAAELQASAAEPSESMTEEELIALAKDVGIPPEHLKQALAEERTRVTLPPPTIGDASGWFGPTTVSATRVITGSPSELLAMLDQWMQREECLQPRRRYAERLTWEPRRDVLGSLRRGLNIGGRGYALMRAAEIGATAVAVEGGRTMVRLDASLDESRRRSVTAGTIVAGGSAAAGASTLAVASAAAGSMIVASMIAAGLAVMGLSGLYATARQQRSGAVRVQTGLEQALDRLEHGEMRRSSTFVDVIAAVARGR